MLALPRRQSLSLLVLVLTIVASAWWIGRPASEAAVPPVAQAAPPQPALTGAGNITLAMSPSLTLPITSVQFGAGRGVANNGEVSDLSLSEITVTLASAPADPRLLASIGDGDHLATVTILSPDKNGRRQWVLTSVVISGFSTSRDTKAGTTSLSLNYATVTLTTLDSKGHVVSSYCAVNRPGSSCDVS